MDRCISGMTQNRRFTYQLVILVNLSQHSNSSVGKLRSLARLLYRKHQKLICKFYKLVFCTSRVGFIFLHMQDDFSRDDVLSCPKINIHTGCLVIRANYLHVISREILNRKSWAISSREKSLFMATFQYDIY